MRTLKQCPAARIPAGVLSSRSFTVAGMSLVLLLFSAGVTLALDPINQSFFGGVAIEGYDPVAYFTAGEPMEGSEAHEYEWMDATWHFASAENRALFVADPERYAPRYGGYCAYAVSQGITAGIDPEAWKVVDDKLYLNLNQNIKVRWEAKMEQYIQQADTNWPKLLAEG